jgi:hypothetical protein
MTHTIIKAKEKTLQKQLDGDWLEWAKECGRLLDEKRDEVIVSMMDAALDDERKKK